MPDHPKLWRNAGVFMPAASIALLVYVFYLPVRSFEFISYDDGSYVTDNAILRLQSLWSLLWFFAHSYFNNYAPVTMMTHAADLAIWGLWPGGHHLTNVLLHSLNCAGVFVLSIVLSSLRAVEDTSGGLKGAMMNLRHLSPSAVGGMGAASLLFGVHPIHVESVAWISDRKDLVCLLFLLLSMLCYLYSRRDQGPTRPFVLSIIFYALALLSKSVAVAMPIALILTEYWLAPSGVRREQWKSIILRILPFLILSMGAAILALLSVTHGRTLFALKQLPVTARLLLPLYSLLFYPAKLVWPAHLVPIYSPPPVLLIWLSAALFCALGIGWFSLAQRLRKTALLSLGTYGAFLLPTLIGHGAGIQPWADRYFYISSVPFFVLAGVAGTAAWNSVARREKPAWLRTTLIAGGIGILTIYGYLAQAQLNLWRNSNSFWYGALEKSPDLPRALNNVGAMLFNRGEADSAIMYYRRALSGDSTEGRALSNLGLALLTRGDTGTAIELFKKAQNETPDFLDGYTNLGRVYLTQRKWEEAEAAYSAALAVDPNSPKAWFNLGIISYQTGDHRRALTMFEKTAKLQPEYVNAHINIAAIYQELGDEAAAIEALKNAARLGSKDAQKALSEKGVPWP